MGGPLGTEVEVMAGLATCFGEVRSERVTVPKPHHGLVGWGKMYGVWSDLVTFVQWGPRLRYPQGEAYVFDPDGLVSFCVGQKVRRLHAHLHGDAAQFEAAVKALGWTHRAWSVRDWFRTR